MKLGIRWKGTAAIVLIECLIYLSVYALILSLAASALYRCHTQSAQLRRNTEDISRTLHAGEIWRKDVRASRAAEIFEVGEQPALRLDQGENEILYTFYKDTVYRIGPGETNWARFLTQVKGSQMIVEARAHTEICKWEVELRSTQKTVRLKPLFTFLSPPGAKGNK